MDEHERVDAAPVRCQARPRAARPAYREDMLCASNASTTVLFRGVELPVCRMHAATYARWESEAEWNAAALWAWHRPAIVTAGGMLVGALLAIGVLT
jgi:hypothetical protein